MGLQVRLRHAVGERAIELPDRPVDNPIIVGRSADADVKVPSIGIHRHHLVLFVHEGAWIVQNVPGVTDSTVNGAALAGPRVVQTGDRIALGADAGSPVIEIGTVTATVDDGMGQSAGGIAERDPYELRGEHAHAPAIASSDDIADWMSTPVMPSYSTPRKHKSSMLSVVFAVLLATGIVGGAGAFIYLRSKNPPAPTIVTVTAPPVRRAALATVPTTRPAPAPVAARPVEKTLTPPPPPPDLTDDATANAGGSSATRSSPIESPVAEPEEMETQAELGTIKPRSVLSEKPAETENATAEWAKAWKRVESVYYDTNPAKAILQFDAFAAEYPGVQIDKLTQYREDMLDKIWWNRVEELTEKRNELTAAIKDTETKIKNEGEDGAAYRKTVLEPLLEDQKTRLAALGETLAKQMKYTLSDPPPFGKDAEMAALRTQRDPKLYDAWKKSVLKHLKETHGSYPWANER